MPELSRRSNCRMTMKLGSTDFVHDAKNSPFRDKTCQREFKKYRIR